MRYAIIVSMLMLSGCSLSLCDLYPAGNSHAGNKCLFCHKHWDGSWHDNQTEGKCKYE